MFGETHVAVTSQYGTGKGRDSLKFGIFSNPANLSLILNPENIL